MRTCALAWAQFPEALTIDNIKHKWLKLGIVPKALDAASKNSSLLHSYYAKDQN